MMHKSHTHTHNYINKNYSSNLKFIIILFGVKKKEKTIDLYENWINKIKQLWLAFLFLFNVIIYIKDIYINKKIK